MTTKKPADLSPLIDAYESGRSLREVAKVAGVDNSTLYHWFRQAGVPMSKCRRDKQKVLPELIELYISGVRTPELERRFGIRTAVILNWLRESGTDVTRYIYDFRDDYFEKIDSQEKAYFLGYLTADGAIQTGPPKWIVRLHSKDRYPLDQFVSAIGGDQKVTEHQQKSPHGKTSTAYYLRVHSKRMVLDLIRFGLTANKSTREVFYRDLATPLIRHYIRGLIDGDGTVGWRKRKPRYGNPEQPQPYIQLVGSLDVVSNVIEVIQMELKEPPVKPGK